MLWTCKCNVLVYLSSWMNGVWDNHERLFQLFFLGTDPGPGYNITNVVSNHVTLPAPVSGLKYAAIWQCTKMQSCLFWKQHSHKTYFHIVTEVIQINYTDLQLRWNYLIVSYNLGLLYPDFLKVRFHWKPPYIFAKYFVYLKSSSF